MVLMHHLNADPGVEAEGGETHVERACMESESQMSEEWNIKCSSLFQGFCSVTKKKIEKKGELFSLKLTITHFTIFQKGLSQAYATLRIKRKALKHANEVNSEQMCGTPETGLQRVSLFSVCGSRRKPTIGMIYHI